MTESINVLAVAGSLRRASINRGLARAAAALDVPGVVVTEFDIIDVPLYNGDVEEQGDPAPVAQLKAAVKEADGLLLATPEYNRGMSGVLKNALDWASRPPDQALKAKPVALIGATPGGFGTRAAQFQIRQILGNPGSPVLPKPELWVSGASEKFDADGNLTDEKTREEIADVLAAFRDWIAALA
ncbi:MAG: NADPH-dependent FMN reductase [Gaiellaceae bacterium]